MYYLEVIQETIGSTLMVFTSLVFLTLLAITIWLIAEDPRQFTIAISAIWEIISGTCRLHCRSKRNVELGQGLKSLPLNNGQASKTFKQALGQTLEQEDMPNLGPTPGAIDLGLDSNPVTKEKVQESAQQTQTPVAQSITVDGERQVIKNCVCEPCACDVVENIVRTTKPAENAFYNFKESLVNSLIFQKLNDIYTHVAASYPAAIEYLEEDKIDSQENFYFLKTEEGQPKAGTLCKAVNTNKRPLYRVLPRITNPSTTSSVSKPLSPTSSSKIPSSHSLHSAMRSLHIHPDKAGVTPEGLAVTIRDTTPNEPVPPVQVPSRPPPRESQSISSLDKQIEQFISNGPPESPIQFTCPTCKASGTVCVSGCPKRHTNSNNKHKQD